MIVNAGNPCLRLRRLNNHLDDCDQADCNCGYLICIVPFDADLDPGQGIIKFHTYLMNEFLTAQRSCRKKYF